MFYQVEPTIAAILGGAASLHYVGGFAVFVLWLKIRANSAGDLSPRPRLYNCKVP